MNRELNIATDKSDARAECDTKGELWRVIFFLFSNLSTQVFIQSRYKRAPKRMEINKINCRVKAKDINNQELKNEELYTKYKN